MPIPYKKPLTQHVLKLTLGAIMAIVSTSSPLPFAPLTFTMSAWASPETLDTPVISVPELYTITREPVIIKALLTLQAVEGSGPLESLKTHQAHILFQNMGQFGSAYAGNDALSLVNQSTGQQMIYISDRHQEAPAEALAALIRHEAMHNDSQNSLLEEASAWMEEGLTWQRMKAKNPTLNTIPVKSSALVDRLNAITVLIQTGQLSREIVKNPAYQALPMTSPGFEAQ
jgi:hypothetical protein